MKTKMNIITANIYTAIAMFWNYVKCFIWITFFNAHHQQQKRKKQVVTVTEPILQSMKLRHSNAEPQGLPWVRF